MAGSILVFNEDADLQERIVRALQSANLIGQPDILTATTEVDAQRHLRDNEIIVVIVGASDCCVGLALRLAPLMLTRGSCLDQVLVYGESEGMLPGLHCIPADEFFAHFISAVAGSCKYYFRSRASIEN